MEDFAPIWDENIGLGKKRFSPSIAADFVAQLQASTDPEYFRELEDFCEGILQLDLGDRTSSMCQAILNSQEKTRKAQTELWTDDEALLKHCS